MSFKCPHCQEGLTQVDIYSRCLQRAEVDDHGVISEYGPVDQVYETEAIKCGECEGELMSYVREE